MNIPRQTPQGKQGGTVPNTPGPGEGTPAPEANAEPVATPGGTGATTAPGSEGVPTPAPDGGAASPTLGEIQDNVYYQVDPSRPDDRLLGSKLKESIHRARQVDDMQSRLHKSLAELEAMKTQLTVAQGQNKEFAENVRLQEQLTKMGITTQGQAPVTGFQAPAPTTPTANLEDEWGIGPDPLGTGQPPAVGSAQPQNSALPNPTEFLRLVDQRVNEIVNQRLGNINDNVANAVGDSVGLVEEERAAREMATRTFAISREVDAQSLRAIGVDETEISRIIDMGQQALEKHQEAAVLMGVTGPDAANSRELARLALVEGQRLRSVAAEARAQAYLTWEASKAQREAKQVLEEGGYVGIDMTDMGSQTPGENRLYKQVDIDAARKKNLAKAKEIVAEQSRLTLAAGG